MKIADTNCSEHILKSDNGVPKKERDSNFELFRILLMLMIIAHHYVVNSGLTSLYDFKNITGNMIFLQFFGFGGKTIINCFVLITGYFMAKSNFKPKKLLKLYLEIKFYDLTIYAIFLATGYVGFSPKDFIKTIFSVVYWVGRGFAHTFLFLYMLVPFLNILIRNMSKRLHFNLLAILIFMFTIISTFSYANDTFNYLGWLITIYLIGAYLQMYPNKLSENMHFCVICSVVSILCMWSSIIIVDFVGSKFGFTNCYYLMTDSNKILALICSVSLFMCFKNIKIKKNLFINWVASSTFGVLLIHANSDTMRRFLWKDLLRNTAFYNSSLLVIHALCSVIGVYIVCVLIDQLRIRLIEKPAFSYIDKNWDKYILRYRNSKEKVLSIYHKIAN